MDARPNYQVGGICRKFLTLLPVTKAEAIQTLLNCDWLEQACKNIGKSDWEELRQEFWIKVLELPETTFTNIREIKFFCVRLMINTYTDKWHRKVKPNGSYHLEDYVSQESPGIEQMVIQKDNLLGGIPMYDRVIFKLHERGVSARKIAKFTNINRTEVSSTINRVKKHIANNVKYQPGTN